MSSVRRIEAPPARPPLCTDLVPADRVSDKLREALAERARPDDPDAQPRAFTQHQLETLRAMLDRVIPDARIYAMDLALRLDRMMDEQDGNGWRYEALPTDPDAYKVGLASLDAIAEKQAGCAFRELPAETQDSLLDAIQREEASSRSDGELFDAKQMALWFEEVRSDAVRHYVAHPAVMARIGYSGFANGGGTGEAFSGFQRVGIDQCEVWEPQPVAVPSTEGLVR